MLLASPTARALASCWLRHALVAAILACGLLLGCKQANRGAMRGQGATDESTERMVKVSARKAGGDSLRSA